MQVGHVLGKSFADGLRLQLLLHALRFIVIAEAGLPVVAEHVVLAVAGQVVLDALVFQILVGVVGQIDDRETIEQHK